MLKSPQPYFPESNLETSCSSQVVKQVKTRKRKIILSVKGWLVRNVSDLITTPWQGRVTGREVSRTLVVTSSFTSLSPACAREKLASKNLTSAEWLDVTGLWRRSFTVRKKLQLLSHPA